MSKIWTWAALLGWGWAGWWDGEKMKLKAVKPQRKKTWLGMGWEKLDGLRRARTGWGG